MRFFFLCLTVIALRLSLFSGKMDRNNNRIKKKCSAWALHKETRGPSRNTHSATATQSNRKDGRTVESLCFFFYFFYLKKKLWEYSTQLSFTHPEAFTFTSEFSVAFPCSHRFCPQISLAYPIPTPPLAAWSQLSLATGHVAAALA